MVRFGEGCDFVTDIMCCPILRHTAAHPVVESPRCRPAEVGTNTIILEVLEDFRPFFEQHGVNAFGLAILNRGIDRIRHILFANMDEGIDNTILETCMIGKE